MKLFVQLKMNLFNAKENEINIKNTKKDYQIVRSYIERLLMGISLRKHS